MPNHTTPDDMAENTRTEYTALVSFHNSVVEHRFTLLGFFLATVGLLVQDGVRMREAWLLLALTAAMYIIERRNRVLYTQMSRRAMEIEQGAWGLNRHSDADKGVPMFCRLRQDELPEAVKDTLPDVVKSEATYKPPFWDKWSICCLPCSHSKGLDLLYLAIAGYALVHILRILR